MFSKQLWVKPFDCDSHCEDETFILKVRLLSCLTVRLTHIAGYCFSMKQFQSETFRALKLFFAPCKRFLYCNSTKVL